MPIGFIGTGSMGRTLVEAFIRSKKLAPTELLVTNRTKPKAEKLAQDFPGIRVTSTCRELVQSVDCFFLCIKPKEFRAVLDEIKEKTKPSQIAISITSPVMIKDLEEWLPCKIAKVIPSINHCVGAGNALFIPGTRLQASDREWLWELFSAISRPMVIDECHTRVASDLASCGPAFLANLLQKMANAAVVETQLPQDVAHTLVTQMVLGTGKLLAEGRFTLESLQDRVAVPGGVTREGLNMLEQTTGPVFQELIRLTHNKYEEDIKLVKKSLSGVNQP